MLVTNSRTGKEETKVENDRSCAYEKNKRVCQSPPAFLWAHPTPGFPSGSIPFHVVRWWWVGFHPQVLNCVVFKLKKSVTSRDVGLDKRIGIKLHGQWKVLGS